MKRETNPNMRIDVLLNTLIGISRRKAKKDFMLRNQIEERATKAMSDFKSKHVDIIPDEYKTTYNGNNVWQFESLKSGRVSEVKLIPPENSMNCNPSMCRIRCTVCDPFLNRPCCHIIICNCDTYVREHKCKVSI